MINTLHHCKSQKWKVRTFPNRIALHTGGALNVSLPGWCWRWHITLVRLTRTLSANRRSVWMCRHPPNHPPTLGWWSACHCHQQHLHSFGKAYFFLSRTLSPHYLHVDASLVQPAPLCFVSDGRTAFAPFHFCRPAIYTGCVCGARLPTRRWKRNRVGSRDITTYEK